MFLNLNSITREVLNASMTARQLLKDNLVPRRVRKHLMLSSRSGFGSSGALFKQIFFMRK